MFGKPRNDPCAKALKFYASVRSIFDDLDRNIDCRCQDLPRLSGFFAANIEAHARIEFESFAARVVSGLPKHQRPLFSRNLIRKNTRGF